MNCYTCWHCFPPIYFQGDGRMRFMFVTRHIPLSLSLFQGYFLIQVASVSPWVVQSPYLCINLTLPSLSLFFSVFLLFWYKTYSLQMSLLIHSIVQHNLFISPNVVTYHKCLLHNLYTIVYIFSKVRPFCLVVQEISRGWWKVPTCTSSNV